MTLNGTTIMAATQIFLLFAAIVALSTAQPVDNLPVLKELKSEVLFRTSSDATHPFVLECATTKPSDKVQYTWQKDGKPLDLKARPDVTVRQGEGSLVFTKPQESDEGLYQCFATSDEGVASSRLISVKRTFVEIPKFTLQKHKPVEGRPFKLDCSVLKAYPQPKIEWYRQGADGKYVDILEKRLLESPEGTLYFTNATQKDVDKNVKYICLVESPAFDEKMVAAEHIIEDLTLTKEPKTGELTPQYLSKDMTVKTGDVTMLYCIYGGTPMAHPDWFKVHSSGTKVNVNGQPGDRVTHRNRSAGRRLIIKDTRAEDQSEYTCVANNGVGKPQEHKIKLYVKQMPEFIQKPEPVILTKEGQDVSIPCLIKGVDQVTWTFNGKPLTGRTPTREHLSLQKVLKKDNGYYGCKGANDQGEVYAETLVHVA